MSGTDRKFGQLTKNPASRAVGGKDGFTLMEVMIVTFLVLIVFAGGFGALAQGNRLIEISRDETRASQALQSEVEDIRTYNWDSLITYDGSFGISRWRELRGSTEWLNFDSTSALASAISPL